MTILNVLFVVFVVQIVAELEGSELLEYLVLAVLLLPYFTCFKFTLLCYAIFYSVKLMCL